MPLEDDLRDLIDRTVTAADPLLNEMGELSGVVIAFGDVVITAVSHRNTLTVRLPFTGWGGD